MRRAVLIFADGTREEARVSDPPPPDHYIAQAILPSPKELMDGVQPTIFHRRFVRTFALWVVGGREMTVFYREALQP